MTKPIFFDELIAVRVQKRVLKDVVKIVKKDNGFVYDNVAHFYRVAINKLVRDEKKRLKL